LARRVHMCLILWQIFQNKLATVLWIPTGN
jgi:hypothetical protein